MTPPILVVDDNRELVALLTSLFEGAGYTVLGHTRGKAAVEAARGDAPGVAIIDVLLPDMMGYHVAESMRQSHPDLPIIFMSGVFKGSRHSAEALQRFKGAQYFEKPFDAKKLLGIVQKMVPVAGQPVSTKPSPAPTDFEVDLDIDVEDDGDQDEMELTGRIRVSGGGNITADLQGADFTASASGKGPVSGARPPPPPTEALEADEPPPAAARQGALEDNLPGLITAFFLSKETGELYITKGKVKKVVYFEAGMPVFALSNLAADRFGQFLVRVGKIRPEQLQDVAVVAAQTKKRTGDVLVERGLLKDTERLYYVAQQVKAIIYSLFGWETGQYAMAFGEKARAEHIKLEVFPGNLIIRGIKKLYKPDRLARLVTPEDRFMPSPQPAYQLHEVELEKWEANLLPRIDGTRTNAEIVALAGKPEHQVRAFLAAMMGANILEKRES